MDTLPQARRRSRATASQAESKLFGTLGQRLVRLRLKYKMGLYKNGASPQQLNAVFICVAESGIYSRSCSLHRFYRVFTDVDSLASARRGVRLTDGRLASARRGVLFCFFKLIGDAQHLCGLPRLLRAYSHTRRAPPAL